MKTESELILEFAMRETSTPPSSWWRYRLGYVLDDNPEIPGDAFAEGLAAWRFQVAEAMVKAAAQLGHLEAGPYQHTGPR